MFTILPNERDHFLHVRKHIEHYANGSSPSKRDRVVEEEPGPLRRNAPPAHRPVSAKTMHNNLHMHHLFSNLYLLLCTIFYLLNSFYFYLLNSNSISTNYISNSAYILYTIYILCTIFYVLHLANNIISKSYICS